MDIIVDMTDAANVDVKYVPKSSLSDKIRSEISRKEKVLLCIILLFNVVEIML